MELPRRERPKPEKLNREAEEKELKERSEKEIEELKRFLERAIKDLKDLERGGYFSPGRNTRPLFEYIVRQIRSRFDANDPQINRFNFKKGEVSLLEIYFSQDFSLRIGLSGMANDPELLKELNIDPNDEYRKKLKEIKKRLAQALEKLYILLTENPDLILSASS